jgi:hypothetical protein
MLSWLNPIAAITEMIANLRIAEQNAETEELRIAHQTSRAQLEARRDVLQNRISNIVQGLWAAPFIMYTWKLIVWDKMLGLGATDPLSPELYYMQWTILGFYFLTIAGKQLKGGGKSHY